MTYEIPSLTRKFGNASAEVEACRSDCAVFDFSFIQRARVLGPKAGEIVEQFANRKVSDMSDGKIRYALRLRDDGTVLSDLTVWKFSDEHFEVMSGHPPDIANLCTLGGACVQSLTTDGAVFAVQGPTALEKLRLHCSEPQILANLGYFDHAAIKIGDTKCNVGRLGYTGEAGFELICPRPKAEQLWARLCRTIAPAGFIAADTLRIEAGFSAVLERFCASSETRRKQAWTVFANRQALLRRNL